MGLPAETYYRERLQLVGLEILPDILDGEPFDILSGRAGTAAELAAGIFTDEISAVEPLVIAGIPEIAEAQGAPMTTSEWRQAQTLPRYRRYQTVDAYARHHITALARTALADGAARVTVQALAREGIPINALKRATLGRSYYVNNSAYEASQAYLMTSVHTAAGGLAAARLTILQGVYDTWAYGRGVGVERQRSAFLSMRIGGTPLRAEEIRLIMAHNR